MTLALNAAYCQVFFCSISTNIKRTDSHKLCLPLAYPLSVATDTHTLTDKAHFQIAFVNLMLTEFVAHPWPRFNFFQQLPSTQIPPFWANTELDSASVWMKWRGSCPPAKGWTPKSELGSSVTWPAACPKSTPSTIPHSTRSRPARLSLHLTSPWSRFPEGLRNWTAYLARVAQLPVYSQKLLNCTAGSRLCLLRTDSSHS